MNNAQQTARVGLFFLLGLALTWVTFETLSDGKVFKDRGYTLIAGFESLKELKQGDEVRMAGVKIGSVEQTNLAPSGRRAEAVLRIDPKITIKSDATASIVMAGLIGMALSHPQSGLQTVVWCALLVAFASATQDIALDAYRIESAEVNAQAALAASYQTGYRLAMIWAGAGVLWIAARAEIAPAVGQAVAQGAAYQNGAWQAAYLVMAASMAVGVVTVLFSREPAPVALPPAKNAAEWIQGALVAPFADFLRRYGWQAALILALIAVYRISDVVMGIMANPFYVDMGFTKDEVAAVTKVYG
eukprot:gene49921-66869_t